VLHLVLELELMTYC